MVNDAYLWNIPYSQHGFLLNFVFYSRKAYLAHQYKKMLYHPYSYRIPIDENPIPLQRICVLSYLCLLLTKLLFETSIKSFQYNTEDRRLSNYSIKMILCSHYRSRCKGLCQNKKHAFDQYTKGGHFCAAHMALNSRSYICIVIRQNIYFDNTNTYNNNKEREKNMHTGKWRTLWWWRSPRIKANTEHLSDHTTAKFQDGSSTAH